MKTRQTPGPWKVEPAYTGTNRFPISHRIDGVARGILAEVNGQGGTEQENTANARLIAAAPQLREALELAQATIERLQGQKHHGLFSSVQGTIDVIKAALSAAL